MLTSDANDAKGLQGGRGEIWSWAFYDFANSAFATSITAVLFNYYFVKVVVGPNGARILGMLIPSESLWAYVVAASMAIICLTAPVLGAIADFSGAKKRFLFVYCYAGCVATCMLCTVLPGNYVLGSLLFVAATVGFAGGNVFYNALLPELADETTIGRVSGLGWAVGYAGGGLCLALNLLMISKSQWFGIDTANHWPTRVSFIVVGLWWGVFALPVFLFVRERAPRHRAEQKVSYFAVGFGRLRKTFHEIRRYRELAKFLVAFLVYNDAIQTIIVMASPFGAKVIGMSPSELIACFLMIQGVALVGSASFGYLVDFIGNKSALAMSLIVWLACVAVALVIQTRGMFWALSVVIGLVLGGSQSASRSMMGLFTPRGKSAEFFSFYAISGKLAALVGPVVFGVASQAWGFRSAIGAMGGFLLVGLAVLSFVDERKGIDAARG